MKSNLWKAITMTAAVAVTTTVLLAERPDLGLSANVPFRFETGKVSVEQGRFEVRYANSSSVLMLGVKQNKHFTVVTRRRGAPSGKARLTFHKHGETWFLREVQMPNSADVLVLPRSERLKEFERAGASRGPVEVAIVEATIAAAASGAAAE